MNQEQEGLAFSYMFLERGRRGFQDPQMEGLVPKDRFWYWHFGSVRRKVSMSQFLGLE